MNKALFGQTLINGLFATLFIFFIINGKEPQHMEKSSLFSNPQIIGSLQFDKNHLTYQHSDMGPDAHCWPDPICFSPEFGLIAVERGIDYSSMQLKAFDRSLVHLFDRDLIESLKINDPSRYSPVALNWLTDGNIGVLVIQSDKQVDEAHDSSKYIEILNENHKTIAFDLESDFVYKGNSYIPSKGIIFNMFTDFATKFGWQKFGNHSKGVKLYEQPLQNNTITAFCNQGLVIFNEKSDPIFSDIAGHTKRLNFIGKKIGCTDEDQVLEPISGYGSFLGIIHHFQFEKLPGSSNITVEKRNLDILFLDRVNGSLYCIGNTELRPIIYGANNLEYYNNKQTRIDSLGNVFEIALGTKKLDVYKYEIDNEMIKNFLKAGHGDHK
jgi:hypothetical protein